MLVALPQDFLTKHGRFRLVGLQRTDDVTPTSSAPSARTQSTSQLDVVTSKARTWRRNCALSREEAKPTPVTNLLGIRLPCR